MLDLLARLLGGTIKPLTDQLADTSARFVKKLALFVVAGVSLILTFIALTVAFSLWIGKLAGPIAAALAFAGVYFFIAVVALIVGLYDGSKKGRAAKAKRSGAKTEQTQAEQQRRSGLDEQIDSFVAPLIRVLQQLGFRREQLAVLAGASVAKQLGPLPLVGLAVVAGFLIGRLTKGGRSLVSLDAITALLSSGLFGFGKTETKAPDAEQRP